MPPLNDSDFNAHSSLNSVFEYFLKQPGRKPITKKKFRYKLKHFLAAHGESTIGSIDLEILETVFENLENKGYAEATLAMWRSCFVTFFEFCSKWTGFNPARGLPRFSQKPPQVITADPDDVEEALKICESVLFETDSLIRDAAIFAMGATGMRLSNIYSMRYTDTVNALKNPIEINGERIYLVQTKGKESMEAVLDVRKAKILKKYIEIRSNTPTHNKLFVVVCPEVNSFREPLSKEGYLKARNLICRLAGVPSISFQKMRRLVGTNVARKYGVAVAAQVLGHKSGVSVILDHYYNPDKEMARIAALDAQTAGKKRPINYQTRREIH